MIVRLSKALINDIETSFLHTYARARALNHTRARAREYTHTNNRDKSNDSATCLLPLKPQLLLATLLCPLQSYFRCTLSLDFSLHLKTILCCLFQIDTTRRSCFTLSACRSLSHCWAIRQTLGRMGAEIIHCLVLRIGDATQMVSSNTT